MSANQQSPNSSPDSSPEGASSTITAMQMTIHRLMTQHREALEVLKQARAQNQALLTTLKQQQALAAHQQQLIDQLESELQGCRLNQPPPFGAVYSN